MYLARVIGTVVMTVKYEGIEGYRLMIVEPIGDDEQQTVQYVAVDATQAGVGDRVFLVGSREATLALDNEFVPVDAAIVGAVADSVKVWRLGSNAIGKSPWHRRGDGQAPIVRRSTHHALPAVINDRTAKEPANDVYDRVDSGLEILC